MEAVQTSRYVDWLNSLHSAEPCTHRNLGMVLFWVGGDTPVYNRPYLLASAAIQQNLLDIQETGTVQSLNVCSRSSLPIFFPAGLRITGGGQNRVSVVSTLLAPEAKATLATRCVEKRRWNPQAGSPMSVPEHSSIVPSSVSVGSMNTDQGHTWQGVDTVVDLTDTQTGTADLDAVHRHTAAQRMDYESVLTMPGGDQPIFGCFFALQRRGQRKSIALDLFCRPAIARDLFPHLRDSVAIDALAAQWENEADDIDPVEMIAEAAGARTAIQSAQLAPENVPGNHGQLLTGVGKDGEQIAVLMDGDTPVHLRLRRTIA